MLIKSYQVELLYQCKSDINIKQVLLNKTFISTLIKTYKIEILDQY